MKRSVFFVSQSEVLIKIALKLKKADNSERGYIVSRTLRASSSARPLLSNHLPPCECPDASSTLWGFSSISFFFFLYVL